MSNPVVICNLGLGKISAHRVSSLTPPRSVIEKHCADSYERWKRQELSKRRWTFATDYVTLTLSETISGLERPYKYEKPADMLRPIRPLTRTWDLRSGYFYSSDNPLVVEGIFDRTEDTFDELFIDVLACRVAIETVELATQSSNKKNDALVMYREAVDMAYRMNAFTLEPQDASAADEDFSILNARLGYPP